MSEEEPRKKQKTVDESSSGTVISTMEKSRKPTGLTIETDTKTVAGKRHRRDIEPDTTVSKDTTGGWRDIEQEDIELSDRRKKRRRDSPKSDDDIDDDADSDDKIVTKEL